ncbi:sulfite reductase [Desulfohalovibrio reitneri]|uniref:sulfite reductase n=1 Tax=Desulfohalovibrio reitneri TaxID=1307759 RepID=UPI0004A70E33|nr:sulfite reductase [Desulfohalovibrio reitneri]
MTTTIPEGAVKQRDGTYALKPRTPLGRVTPEILETAARVAREHGAEYIKLTSGQRLLLAGFPEENVAAAAEDLGELGRVCKHYVQACPGNETCAHGLDDSMGLGKRIEDMLFERDDLPGKVKAGVSGCPRCCAESMVRDIGLVATPSGWRVIFGGNAGFKPRVGDVVAEKVTADEALDIVRKLLDFYAREGKPKQRTARFAEKVGLDALRRAARF